MEPGYRYRAKLDRVVDGGYDGRGNRPRVLRGAARTSASGGNKHTENIPS